MPLGKRKSENAWLEADRWERRKTVLIVLGIIAVTLGTIGLLAWAIFQSSN